MSSLSADSPSSAPLTPPGRPDRAERSARSSVIVRLLEACGDDADEQHRLRGELVLVNRAVAEAVATRYRGRGVAQEDLTQVGYEGLVKAAAKFDPAIRSEFLTYAVPTIRGEIQRYFRDLGWVVRPPRRIQELQYRVGQARSELVEQLGQEPDRATLIRHLGVPQRDYDEAVGAAGAFRPLSLDQPLTEQSDLTLIDLLDGAAGTDETEDRVMLVAALAALDPRERRMVFQRYWQDLKQWEIGAEMGVTQMQVSRLLQRVIDKLRRELGEPTER